MVMSGVAATAAGAGLFGDVSAALAMPKADRDRLTPAEILGLMKSGNERNAFRDVRQSLPVR